MPEIQTEFADFLGEMTCIRKKGDIYESAPDHYAPISSSTKYGVFQP